jgi:cytochrome P450
VTPADDPFASLATKLARLSDGMSEGERDAVTALIGAAAARLRSDPYPQFERLLDDEERPVQRSDERGGWLVARHAHVCAVERDARMSFAARHADAARSLTPAQREAMPTFLRLTSLHLGHTDAPAHARLRDLFRPATGPRAVRRAEPAIRRCVDELVPAGGSSGELDAVADYAARLPMPVGGALLGLSPAEFAQIEGATADYLGPLPSDVADARRKERAALALRDHFARALAERRTAPSPPADVLGELARRIGGPDGYGEEEVVAACVQILTGGYESLRHMVSVGLCTVVEHPAALAAVRARGLGAGALEELLRYDGVVQQLTRTATEDLELGGARIAAGEKLLLLPGAANRDPRRFQDPAALDLDRRANSHLAFGTGPHACPGAGLARTVGRIAIGALVERSARLELVPPGPVWEDDVRARGLVSLRLGYEMA